MIGRVVMLGAAAVWTGALLLNRKADFYSQLFDTLQNCQKYHMDYVEDIKDLPKNSPMILYGPPEPLPGNECKDKIIASSFIKKSS